MRESLENVKVGDVVIERGPFLTEIKRVTKITPKYIVIGQSRYHKNNGRRCGSDYGTYISIPREGEIESLKEKAFVWSIIRKLGNLSEKDITYDQAVKIKEVLGL